MCGSVGVDAVRWGIGFLANCNSDCNGQDIVPEVDSWLKSLERWRHLLGGISVSRDVILVKNSDPLAQAAS